MSAPIAVAIEALPAPETAVAKKLPHTPEELRQEPNYPLWVRLRDGDRTAKDDLVVRYAPLVKYAIGRLAIGLPAAMDTDDVLSAGTVGLLHAMDRYDPDQGVRFETYALPRIRGAILDAVRSLSPLSRGAGRRAKHLEEVTAELAQRLGRAPTQAELAEELGVTPAEVTRQQLEAAHAIVSLEGTRGGGDDDDSMPTLADLLRDPHAQGPEEAAEEAELADRLRKAIENVSERERLVLSLYYQEELTLKEISRVLEVSESRVSQIHTAAVLKLRALLRTTAGARPY